MKFFFRYCLALTAFVVLPFDRYAAAQTPGVTDNEIRIGSFGPITGANFVYGKMTMNGVEAVFQKVNEQGGVNGRKLVLVREDDQCDPSTAIAAVKKLIYSQNVFAIIGGGCSNAVLAAKPDIVSAKIPFINFAAAADAISAPPVPNVFTSMLTGAKESRIQLKYAISRGAKRIAVVSQRDAWGRDRYPTLMEEFAKAGIKPVADEEMNINSNDATAQVLKVRETKPDAVILLLYPKPAAIFLRDAARLGFTPDTIGQTAIPDLVAFRDQVGIAGATDRFVTISPIRFSPTDPEAAEWRRRLESMFPGDRLHSFNLFGVASAQLVVETLKRTGKNLTRENFVSKLEGVQGLEVDTYPGKLSCADHQCHKTAVWLKLRPGTDKVEVTATTTLQ